MRGAPGEKPGSSRPLYVFPSWLQCSGKGGEAGSDPIWLHCCIFQRFQRFQQFRVSFQENLEFILAIIHMMENVTFLVQIRHAVCACALLVFLAFLVVCACSLFFNAVRWSQNSSQRVLIVLDYIMLLKWIRIGS